eukprot:jgi/Botrbrau1/23536/Bobra.0141s0007.1
MREQKLDPESGAMVVKPYCHNSGGGVCRVQGSAQAVLAARRLLDFTDRVVVQPALWRSTEFCVYVLEGPDGPVALLPSELEFYSVEDEIFEADLELRRSAAKSAGMSEGVIKRGLRRERDTWFVEGKAVAAWDYRIRRSSGEGVFLHTPARLPLELNQAIRLAAVKAFKDLKLRDVARFDGWVVPPAVPLRDPAADIPPPPDVPYNLPIEEFVKMFPDRELVRWQDEPRFMDPRVGETHDIVETELVPYPREDVSAVSPSSICSFPSGTVMFEGVSALGTLETRGLLFRQAAELGFSHSAILRQIVAAAARRQEKSVPQPPPMFQFEYSLLDAPVRTRTSPPWPLGEPPPPNQEEFEELALEVADRLEQEGLLEVVDDVPEGDDEQGADATAAPNDEGREWTLEDEEAYWRMPSEDEVDQVSAELAALVFPDLAARAAEHRLRQDKIAAACEFVGDVIAVEMEDLSQMLAEQAAEEAAGEAAGEPEPEQTGEQGRKKPRADGSSRKGEAEGKEQAPGEELLEEGEEAQQDLLPQLSEEDWAVGWYGRPPSVAPLRVWVLAGGESGLRNEGLRGAVDMWLRLRSQQDLLVELFLLAPREAGSWERDRRRLLLTRRNQILKLGGEEDEVLPAELSTKFIRAPVLAETPLESQAVWCVPHARGLSFTVEEMAEACGNALVPYNRAAHMQPVSWRAERMLREEVQAQVTLAGIPGVGGTWGGDLTRLPPPPLYKDLASFVANAKELEAVVVVAVMGRQGEDGALQEMLQEAGVPYTGSSPLISHLCQDKLMLNQVLLELDLPKVAVPPELNIPEDTLLDCLEELRVEPEQGQEEVEEEVAAEFYFQVWSEKLDGPAGLTIRPVKEGGLLGRARLGHPHGLVHVCHSLQRPHARDSRPTPSATLPTLPSPCRRAWSTSLSWALLSPSSGCS